MAISVEKHGELEVMVVTLLVTLLQVSLYAFIQN